MGYRDLALKKLPKPPKVHYGHDSWLRTQCGRPTDKTVLLVSDNWSTVDCNACIRSYGSRHDK